MVLPLLRVVELAALALCVCVGMAGRPTGHEMAHAENAKEMQSVQYPWKGTDDEIVVNLAIGSLRDSLTMWLTTERGVPARWSRAVNCSLAPDGLVSRGRFESNAAPSGR